MVQVVKSYCDYNICANEIKSYRVRVTHEYSSRSIYGKEYCSVDCMIEDANNFHSEARRKDLRS